MLRHEFSLRTKTQAAERANGHCERCHAPLRPGKIRFDHEIPDALGGENTLENCRVVCINCDAPKTKTDITRIAKAKRNFRKDHGIKRQSRFAYSRNTPWKKKIDGSIVRR